MFEECINFFFAHRGSTGDCTNDLHTTDPEYMHKRVTPHKKFFLFEYIRKFDYKEIISTQNVQNNWTSCCLMHGIISTCCAN